MEHEQETGFNDFMDAFDDSADYQTGEAEEPAVEEGAAESTEETAQPEDHTDTSEGSQDAGQEETGEDQGKSETDSKPQNETFTLKVNKEEKTYSREEVISLAQKGADYDRDRKSTRLNSSHIR